MNLSLNLNRRRMPAPDAEISTMGKAILLILIFFMMVIAWSSRLEPEHWLPQRRLGEASGAPGRGYPGTQESALPQLRQQGRSINSRLRGARRSPRADGGLS